jgi:plasmid maintenance system antidote protein VapI
MNKKNDNSGNLFTHIITSNNLKNDAALARFLEVTPPVISKIRHGRMHICDGMLLRTHETTGIPVKEMRILIAG